MYSVRVYVHIKKVSLRAAVVANRSITASHTRTVVRECCKGDDASQWGNRKRDPYRHAQTT